MTEKEKSELKEIIKDFIEYHIIYNHDTINDKTMSKMYNWIENYANKIKGA